ncbi:NnrS family protein [uncultured Pelagimonas sp.]|uniref:NnrS family protein n=1 Tax=uncultured Pelagimonas sp. TaxID=1618102 RepID=UPI0026222B2E|nr:NnrS family protein [uncultured Pelagimonas sp.]
MTASDWKRLFSAGYRVFFLLAGLCAIWVILVWEIWQASFGALSLPTAQPPHLWHAHEMIFGYGAAAIAGFLLTAAPSWTKSGPEPTSFFAVTSGLWLAGRLAIWWSGSLPLTLVAIIDLLFLPILAGRILQTLLKRPKPQQLILLVAILVFWSGNVLVHLEWAGLTQDTADQGMRGGLAALCALIVILGGRVTPAFTRNAMLRVGREENLPSNPTPLAVASIAPALLVPLALLTGAPNWVMGIVALVAGCAALVRVGLWHGAWTLRQPILWTLHLSYALNAIGFVMLGLAAFDIGSEIAALHVLGIGGVGGMTLSVMSRAALGHSGRDLIAPKPVAIAYVLVPLAALIRVAATIWPDLYMTGILISGALWIVAFALYTIALWPIFWGERIKKQPVSA